MKLAEALRFYRANMNEADAALLADFNALPVDDRLELVMHMHQHLSLTIEGALDIDLHEEGGAIDLLDKPSGAS